ncbi:2805_t:CDS:2 [Funneliformis caledonium]|uniref:2805_t:CDS:1 n=1 Tax=Funneliformis caledonium TaxID=1117310 RepID=A0A9N9N4C1_9GLOM|nr:2805_t:CDS:2 [Funneliformis caledonium]
MRYTRTGKSHFAKRFSDRFIDGDDLIFNDSISKDLFTQGRFDDLNELARKRLGEYSGDKIIYQPIEFTANKMNLKVAVDGGYTFVDVNNFKEKDEAFLEFADELEKEHYEPTGFIASGSRTSFIHKFCNIVINCYPNQVNFADNFGTVVSAVQENLK